MQIKIKTCLKVCLGGKKSLEISYCASSLKGGIFQDKIMWHDRDTIGRERRKRERKRRKKILWLPENTKMTRRFFALLIFVHDGYNSGIYCHDERVLSTFGSNPTKYSRLVPLHMQSQVIRP